MAEESKYRYSISIHLFIFITLASVYQSALKAQNAHLQAERFPDPVFEHLTLADGLPEPSIRCIFQDHLGYLWLGTQMGLVKYDGYNMTVYQNVYNDSFSISHNNIFAIYEDKANNLWVGTRSGGLNRFDRYSETFKSYLHDPEDSASINSDYIRCIFEYEDGKLLVGTYNGLNIFDVKNEIFEEVLQEDSTYSDVVYNYISSLITQRKRLCSILEVGNNADIARPFKITQKTTVLTIVMDEAGFDRGWLENSVGRVIAGGNKSKAIFAGGHRSNQVEIAIDTLEAGNYRLRYQSDEGVSFNSWGGNPPDHPDFWGIQVIALTEKEDSITELLTKKKSSPVKREIKTIIEDRLTSTIFLGAANKILFFNKEKKILRNQKYDSDSNDDLGDILSMYQSSDGSVWIRHHNGLAKFNTQKNSIKDYQPDSPALFEPVTFSQSHLTEDKNGLIWATPLDSGLVVFDPRTESFRNYKHDPRDSKSISSNIIWSVYKDRSGIIWVGTGWAGLNKWNKKKNRFTRFNKDSNNPDGKTIHHVRHVDESPDGMIWLATENGLISFNHLNNEFQTYQYAPSSPNPSVVAQDKGTRVNCIQADGPDSIWFGTDTKGLGRFDAKNKTFKFFSHDPNNPATIGHNSVRHFLDEGNILWIGSFGGGLIRVDKKRSIFKQYVYDANDPKSISQNLITSLYRDRSGTLWIGTNNRGLNRFNESDESFESFNLGRSTTSINAIYEDRKNNLWIGIWGVGIYLFDRNKRIFTEYLNEKNGLAHNLVESILEDKSGNIWIATDNGLSKFDLNTHAVKNLTNIDSWRGSAVVTSMGNMLLGSHIGFTMFHPDSIKDDPVPPLVVISKVSLFNRPQQQLSCNDFIPEVEELQLLYDENDLRFDYVGLQYAEPAKNQYKYMLENYDDDWIDAGTQRNATYTNLDAGEYIFRVTAANADGVWNKDGASLKIIIPPPFWATTWAYGFYILLFGVILWGIRKYELNRLNWKNQFKLDEVKLKEREETDKMKSRFFANISHEFRTPLTLILGPLEKINQKTAQQDLEKNVGLIKRNAQRLLNLVNQLLDLSKLEAGKLKLKAARANIVPFVKGIVMLFESMAEQKQITLKFGTTSDDIPIYFDRDQMAKILSNLLSNAFKFTAQGGQISVNINIPTPESSSDKLEIIVRDSGIGISEEEMPKLFDQFYQVDSSQTREHEGTGIGLALIKELVELHHGQISVESSKEDPLTDRAGWTEFTVALPLGKAHLDDDAITETGTGDTYLIPISDYSMRSRKESPNEQNNHTAAVDTYFESSKDDPILILVVEDNQDVREYIKDALGDTFKIEEASNGQQGVQKAEQIIPDIIISDIMMPVMDGYELARILKNDEKTNHIPIILLTARSEQESKLQGLETGADDYLTKPFDTKELKIRIRNLIHIRKKLQQKYGQADYIAESEGKKLSSHDERFMSKVVQIIKNHISEETFSPEQFASELYMSRMQLHRKLKALTGKSAGMYMQAFRLFQAKKMLQAKHANVSEIAYAVGFSSPAYFSRCFKKEFGISPSEV